jgi:hypothetical protein
MNTGRLDGATPAPRAARGHDGGDGLRRFAHASHSVALLSNRAAQRPHRLYTRTPVGVTSR